MLVGIMSHGMCFVQITKSGRRANIATTACATFTWLVNVAVVLNIYNGDILSLHENYEYTLPHFLTLAAAIISDDDDILLWLTFSISILMNLYWVAAYPFSGDGDSRHRTEFYDTQCYITVAYHTLLVQRIMMWQPQVR